MPKIIMSFYGAVILVPNWLYGQDKSTHILFVLHFHPVVFSDQIQWQQVLFNVNFSIFSIYYVTGYFSGFYNTLDWNFFSNDRQCHDNVRAAFAEINRRIVAGEEDSLQNDLDLCHPVDTENPSDIALFYESLIQFITDFIDENQ